MKDEAVLVAYTEEYAHFLGNKRIEARLIPVIEIFRKEMMKFYVVDQNRLLRYYNNYYVENSVPGAVQDWDKYCSENLDIRNPIFTAGSFGIELPVFRKYTYAFVNRTTIKLLSPYLIKTCVRELEGSVLDKRVFPRLDYLSDKKLWDFFKYTNWTNTYKWIRWQNLDGSYSEIKDSNKNI